MSRRKNFLFLILLLVAAYFSFAFVYPGWWTPSWLPKHDFRYGLDLQGGASLIYQADLTGLPEAEKGEALEGVRDVIERRINFFGVAEPRVAIREGAQQLLIEMPGVDNIDEALAMIGETPVLEFKELVEVELTPEELASIEEENQAIRQQAEEVLARALAGEDFAQLAQEYSDCPSAEDGGQLGSFQFEDMVAEFSEAAFALEEGQITSDLVESSFGYHIIKQTRGQDEEGFIEASHILFSIQQSEEGYYWQNTELTGRHLATARRSLDAMTGQAIVELEFNQEGAELFENVTARNVGQPLAIFLDGFSIIDTTGDGKIDASDLYAPVVQDKITGGKAVISGDMGAQEAADIARRLRSGALPVPIELVSQKTVGPTLGRESLEKSLYAAAWGLLAIMILMIIFYRFPGFISAVALILFTIFLLALFKLIPQITLTMAGIGGAILSIGMAVDANVLIFERMKEEIREGRSLDRAVENGFQRSWPSIRDGSFTTLGIAGIMWLFGTSFIRGFAMILGLGVFLSLFSAIIVTRLLLRLCYSGKVEKLKWLWPS